MFVYDDGEKVERFQPQPGQLTPEFIALSVGVPTSDLRGLKKDLRMWIVSQDRFVPALPALEALSGEYTIVVKKPEVQQTPLPSTTARPSNIIVESHQVSPSLLTRPEVSTVAVVIIQVSNGKGRIQNVQVSKAQLFSHASLYETAQLRPYCWGAARQASYVASITCVLTLTQEASKRMNVRRQAEPGMAWDHVVQFIEKLYPLLLGITLPLKTRKGTTGLLEDEGT